MYDLIVYVLGSSKNEARLRQFLEIGIKSLKYKTKVVYLAGEAEPKPNFIQEEWHNIKGPLSCRFLSHIKTAPIEESRWILQVDDDSCTDLDKTLEIIDRFYDYQDPIILTGSCVYFIHGKTHGSFYMEDNLQKIAIKMGLKELFLGTKNLNHFDMIPRFKHAWEQSMLSFKAVEKIRNSCSVNEFLELCTQYEPQYTDQVPYFAAKLAKVPIDECFIFCPLPIAEEYTAINKNGRYTHIHHVLEYWDELENFKEIIRQKVVFDNKKSASDALRSRSLVNTVWSFRTNEIKLGLIRLGKNGIVEVYKNPNEVKWKLNADRLSFYDKDGQITSELKKIDDTTYKGQSLRTSDSLILKKIDIVSLVGMGGLA
jgi:hypothetical protein